MINAKTKLCCIIGNPVEHSLSPQLHNAGYKALGLNFVFLAFRVTDLRLAIQGLRAVNAQGIVVTIPHKQEVMKYVDRIDETAKDIGAVNTIINRNGNLWAINTDWIGGMAALREKTVVKGKTVAVLGAGGGARAIIYGLKYYGAKEIFVFNRTINRADSLVRDFKLDGAYFLGKIDLIRTADIIINTTSVGMEPNEGISPIPKGAMSSKQIVYDIVYTPKKTKLLQMAKEAKAKVIYGDKMLLYVAIRQFKLFTGKKAPIKKMEEVLQRALK